MEAQLDAVAEGREDWVQMMRRWYDPFAESVKFAGTEMENLKVPPREAGQDCPTCGKPMVIRSSRYGEFVSCSDYPKCKTIVRPESEKSQGECPKCGKPMLERVGRFGKFIACTDYPECKTTKQPASAKVDVPCPKCGGEIVQKRSKKGATFFGCANYPNVILSPGASRLAVPARSASRRWWKTRSGAGASSASNVTMASVITKKPCRRSQKECRRMRERIPDADAPPWFENGNLVAALALISGDDISSC